KEVDAQQREPHTMTLVFDLRDPITPQIERAQDMLLEYQSARRFPIPKRRRRPDLYPMYLAILDADAEFAPENAPNAAIAAAMPADVVKATSAWVKDARAAARMLVAGGYREL